MEIKGVGHVKYTPRFNTGSEDKSVAGMVERDPKGTRDRVH